MAGTFSDIDPRRCAYYAKFLQHGSREKDEVVVWILFIFVIFLLSISSRSFTKSETLARSINDAENTTAISFLTDNSVERARLRQVQINCVLVTSVCSLLGLVTIIIEAFAILSIQFCHGEDLIQLYWGFWTLIQVGSLIAILGINFSQLYGLTDNKNPPWSVALGTPVLVIAACAHMLHNYLSSKWKSFSGKKLRGRSMSFTSAKTGLSMMQPSIHLSRVSTIGNSNGMLIGSSIDNVPLYLLQSQPESLPEGARVLGSIKGGYIIQIEQGPLGLGTAGITRQGSIDSSQIQSVVAPTQDTSPTQIQNVFIPNQNAVA